MAIQPYRKSGPAPVGSRQYYLKRFDALKDQRQLWLDSWLDLADLVLPRSGRFDNVLQESGRKKNNDYNLLNNTGTVALGSLRALLATGITPPSQPWLRFVLQDPALAAVGTNKEWADLAERAFFSIINASNFHSVIPSLYEEVALYGTSAIEIMRHPDKLVSFRLLTAGQYVVAQNIYEEVDTVFYEDVMSVAQIYDKYVIPAEDREAAEMRLTQRVRDLYKKGQVDERFVIIKGVFPNDESPDVRLDAKANGESAQHPFKCVEFQPDDPGRKPTGNEILKTSFYEYMPIMVPRWDLNPGDAYGRSPGMNALGDIKMLQAMEDSKLTIIDKLANPPLISQTDSLEGRINQNAGEITYVAPHGGPASDMVKPLVDMRTNASEISNAIYQVEERIRLAFFGNLARNIESLRPQPGQPGQSRNITATEVDAREQEKFLQLGPVMNRFNTDLLDPMVVQVVKFMIDEGIIPPPPPEMGGVEMDIEFLNIVTAAQRNKAAQGVVDVMRMFADPLLSQHPYFSVLAKKIKRAQAVEMITEGSDVPANAQYSEKEFEQMIQQEEAMQAEQQKLAAAAEMAKVGADMGKIPGSGGRPATQNIAEAVSGEGGEGEPR